MTATTDRSTRFVLDAEAPYLRNAAALWACAPELARAIEATTSGDAYRIENAKSGDPTLAIDDASGKSLYLHSRHQPADEGKRLVEHIDVDEHVIFHVNGFGLGYHVESLFSRASDEAIVCVFEPDLNVLRAAFENRDLTTMIESRRVLFFWRLDKNEIFARLTPHGTMTSMGVETIVHAPSHRRNPQFFDQMESWIDEFAAFTKTSLNTLIINGRRTAENITRNIGWYAATPGLSRLRDQYKGTPAIIVSAGPSLRKNKHLLKDADGKAVIVAVQTTLQPLLEMGIEPQFVTSLDYHDICTRFFQKLPSTLRTELVAEPKATHEIFSLNPGPLSLNGNEFAEGLLREVKLDHAKLPAGATVAHLAYYLAEHLGCDPIIFVGQDLGFSDGLCYAPGTSYEDVWRPELSRFCTLEMKQWEQIARDRPILRKIPDAQGRPMYTEERLFTYLQQFERDFARSKARIIDATEGGALKRGSTPMALAEALAQYCLAPLAKPFADHPGMQWNQLEGCLASLETRKAEAASIEQISRDTLPLLEEIRDHLDDQIRVNRVIASIDLLRSRMNELGQTYDLIMQLTQFTELKRFQADRRISAAKLKGANRQRRQVERDIDNVLGVADAAKHFQTLMAQTINELSNDDIARRQEAA